jgi:hypothetical protein
MLVSNFKKDESAAVTVDWVVLTSAIVGISLAVILFIFNGVRGASEGINSDLETEWSFNFGTEIRNAVSFLTKEFWLFLTDKQMLGEPHV